MSAITLISAGGTFVGCVLLGFVIGVLLTNRTGQGLWILLFVLAGVALGGGLALRQLLQVK